MSLKDPAAKELLANFAYANSLLSYYLGSHINALLDKNVSNKRIYVWTGTHFSTNIDDLARLINERDETITQLPHWHELVALILASRKNYWTGTDASHHLLNCQNGVVNMLTGEIYPHDPNYRFNYVLPIDYSPDADVTKLSAVIDHCFGKHYDTFHTALSYTFSSSEEEGVNFFVFYADDDNPPSSLKQPIPFLPYPKKQWVISSIWYSDKQWYPIPSDLAPFSFFSNNFMNTDPAFPLWLSLGYQKYANNGFRLPPRSFIPENYLSSHISTHGAYL